MKMNFIKTLIRPLLVILVLVFQLMGAHYNFVFTIRFANLEYGWENAGLILITVLLGIVSGIASVYIIYDRPRGEVGESKGARLGAVFLLCISLLAVIFKFIMGNAPYLFPFSILRPGWNELFHWVIYSQVPSLLLGITIGGMAIK